MIQGARTLISLLAEIPQPLEIAQAALVDLELIEPRWFVLNTEFFLYSLRHPKVAKELSRHRKRLRRELGEVLTVLLRAERRELPPGVDLEMFTRMIIAAHEGSQHQSLVGGHELRPGQLQRAMLTLLVTACPKIDGSEGYTAPRHASHPSPVHGSGHARATFAAEPARIRQAGRSNRT